MLFLYITCCCFSTVLAIVFISVFAEYHVYPDLVGVRQCISVRGLVVRVVDFRSRNRGFEAY